MQSSVPWGNLTINLLPAFSSESFNGLNLHTTLMLHSEGSAMLDCWFVGLLDKTNKLFIDNELTKFNKTITNRYSFTPMKH